MLAQETPRNREAQETRPLKLEYFSGNYLHSSQRLLDCLINPSDIDVHVLWGCDYVSQTLITPFSTKSLSPMVSRT